jgi:uncharacterized Zn finger protein
MSWFEFRPYVSVAQRQANAAKEVAKRAKAGLPVSPVKIEGRKITTTFWGNSWCQNLEKYSDFASRLPRGRSYVCNGSVVNLIVKSGHIEALVSGSELYEISIKITPLKPADWSRIKADCSGQVGSLVELLQGKLSKAVMEIVTKPGEGLFPKPAEIKMRCSCPDYAGMCKHLAAVMYGVGNRLDKSPEMLFMLRGVDHHEMIEAAVPKAPMGTTAPTIASDDLSELFGIHIEPATATPPAKAAAKKKATSQAVATKKAPTKKPTAKKPVAKKKPAVKAKPLPKKG